MTSETLDELNMRVTGAIFRAEHEAPGSAEAEDAYRLVSELEERIGSLVPADQLQGALARVGAVTAALRADNWLRAAQLAESYADNAPADLAEQLRELAGEAERASRVVVEPDVRPVSFGLRAA